MPTGYRSLTFDKVTTFVLRRRGVSLDILTFLHPLAGRQIPAGSVERGEEPVEAASREVTEETGFDRLSELAEIGQRIEELEGDAVALIDTVLTDEDGVETDTVKRGHRVRVQALDGARLLVRRLIYDLNIDPPVELPVASGWAEAANFGSRIRRRFFYARGEDDGRSSWTQCADGHTFHVEWRPLDCHLTLTDGQAEWLVEYLGKLQQRAGDNTH